MWSLGATATCDPMRTPSSRARAGASRPSPSRDASAASQMIATAAAGCRVRLALTAVTQRAQTAPAHLARVLPARVVVRRRLRPPREGLGPARHSHRRLDRRRREVLASGHFERLSPAQSARPPALGALDAAWRARHAAHDTRLPQGRHQVRADPRVKAGAIAAPAAARRNVLTFGLDVAYVTY